MRLILLALALLFPAATFAQGVPNTAVVVGTCGSPPNTYQAGQNKPVTQDTGGRNCDSVTLSPGSSIIGTVSIDQSTPGTTNGVQLKVPAPAARNFPGCTVGVASAQCLAGSTAQSFLQLQNTSASASIACRFGGTAVLNSSTSVQLGAGQAASWGVTTAGVPSGALNCIASGASTPLFVEWQ